MPGHRVGGESDQNLYYEAVELSVLSRLYSANAHFLYSDEGYDLTLLLGPLYHLYDEKDKQQAIREAMRLIYLESDVEIL